MLAADLTLPDTIVLGLCLILGVRGAFKGFAWQLVRTIGLIAALWGATRFYGPVGEWLDERLPVPSIAVPMVAWVGITAAVFLIFAYLAHVAKGVVKSVKLGGLDRVLGFLLGCVMALTFAAVGFVVWGHTVVGKDRLQSMLEGSVSARFMAETIDAVQPLFPEEGRNRFRTSLDAVGKAADETDDDPDDPDDDPDDDSDDDE